MFQEFENIWTFWQYRSVHTCNSCFLPAGGPWPLIGWWLTTYFWGGVISLVTSSKTCQIVILSLSSSIILQSTHWFPLLVFILKTYWLKTSGIQNLLHWPQKQAKLNFVSFLSPDEFPCRYKPQSVSRQSDSRKPQLMSRSISVKSIGWLCK